MYWCTWPLQIGDEMVQVMGDVMDDVMVQVLVHLGISNLEGVSARPHF
jgi:hypothetical protein